MSVLTLKTTMVAKDANGATLTNGPTGTEDYTGGNVLAGTVTVPDSTTDQQLDIGGLTGVMRAHLLTDQDVTINVGGVGTDDRFLPAGCGMLLYFSAAATAFYVTNASGAAATVWFVMIEEAP